MNQKQQQYFSSLSQSSYANTTILILGFVGIILGIGFALARITDNSTYIGMSILVSIVMNFIGYFFSESIAIAQSGARMVTSQEEPRLHAIVSKICSIAQLPIPKIYIIEDDAMNAFATGRNKDHASIAVTRGLYNSLSDNELAGVLAHEIGHIKNRDILVSTLAVVLAGSVSLLANILIRDNQYKKQNDGIISIVVSIIVSIIAPIFGLLLQMSISRSREYLADKTGAYITGDPLSLARALSKISLTDMPLQHVNSSTAHLYISNPFGGINMSGLFSTHPSMNDRIQRLQKLDADFRSQ